MIKWNEDFWRGPEHVAPKYSTLAKELFWVEGNLELTDTGGLAWWSSG